MEITLVDPQKEAPALQSKSLLVIAVVSFRRSCKFQTIFLTGTLTDITNSYKNTDAPRYFTGHGVCLGFLSMSFILIAFQWFILGQINKRRDEEHPHPNDYTTEMKRAEMDSGDQASFFRYTR
tara:strand:- start:357 stop:725 length:369 start_codon:yes stop_codon:yes gene_type:complete